MSAEPTDPLSSDAPPERSAVVKELVREYDGFLKIDRAVVDHSRFDGSRQTVTRLSMERGDSVAVLIVDRRRRMVYLTEQFRFPTFAKSSGWIEEVPAGMPRGDESPEDAARREALEETGFDQLKLEHVSTFFVSPGGTSERILLYVAFADGAAPDLARAAELQDAEEDIRLIETPLDGFLQRAALGEIDDAKTLIAGLWLSANRERLAL